MRITEDSPKPTSLLLCLRPLPALFRERLCNEWQVEGIQSECEFLNDFLMLVNESMLMLDKLSTMELVEFQNLDLIEFCGL